MKIVLELKTRVSKKVISMEAINNAMYFLDTLKVNILTIRVYFLSQYFHWNSLSPFDFFK